MIIQSKLISLCPHCNHKAEVKRNLSNLNLYWVQCANHRCRASYGKPSKTREEAVTKWNLYPQLLNAGFDLEMTERISSNPKEFESVLKIYTIDIDFVNNLHMLNDNK